MTPDHWRQGREKAGLTQLAAARALNITQPYLSQLETGVRLPSADLARKGVKLYRLPPVALPLPVTLEVPPRSPDSIQKSLAALGYPPFEHVRSGTHCNPAELILNAVLMHDLDTRLVEALPWVLHKYGDLDWNWLRDRAKLNNAQNRLGYLVHLAAQVATGQSDNAQALADWMSELEEFRLAREGTLCRDSMPERERAWLRINRSDAAAHWALLTGLTSDQLPYAAR